MATSNGLWQKIFLRNSYKKEAPKKERRRSKRYRVDLPVQFRLYLPSRPETSSSMLAAQICDLSEHGIGLLTNTMEYEGLHFMAPDIQTSEQGRLEIRIPFGNEPLSLKGKAIWYVRNPENHAYLFRVGIEFQDLSRDLKERIRTFINIYLSAHEPSEEARL